MTTLLDGRACAKTVNYKVKEKVAMLEDEYGITPSIVVMVVGDNQASQRYVRSKHKKAGELGIQSEIRQYADTISQENLLKEIEELNQDNTVDAILVQMPLPGHIDSNAVIRAIDPDKDVDGFHPVNVGKLGTNLNEYYPVACTPKGIMTLLAGYGIDVKGKNVVIMGRSNIVGKPMAMLMINAGATVSVLNSKTANPDYYTKNADIIVSATGALNTISDSNQIKDGAIIVDVGQNMNEEGKLVGDVNFDKLADKTSFITPVPGGVGPMTIATLMQQTVELSIKKMNKLSNSNVSITD